MGKELKEQVFQFDAIMVLSVIFVKPGTMALAWGLLKKMERNCNSFIIILCMQLDYAQTYYNLV